jgi:uncharacterized membrane protein
MMDLIYAIKFVHVLAAAAMFGTWLGSALFMRLAHGSGNPSVVALVARFAGGVEKTVMIPALALQPISGFALGWAIGLSSDDEFWILLSLALYALVVVIWLAAFRLQIRIRRLAQQAALDNVPLADDYRSLFRLHAVLIWPGLAVAVALFLLMVWQPRPW